MDSKIQFEKNEAPITSAQMKELFDLWLCFFEPNDEDFRNAYENGEELPYNRDIMYLARQDKKLIGTTHLTISKSDPTLGCLGGVATDTEFRGRGIAKKLLDITIEDFRNSGGKALFLGTNNPGAYRIYHRCGFRRIPNTNAMVWAAEDYWPEVFLVDYFRNQGTVTIKPGSAEFRIPVVACIISPHDWQVMDANTNILSMRHTLQKSCGGLFPRYEKIATDGKGTWFAAVTEQNHVVGLSTALLDKSGQCQVDGFCHTNFRNDWNPLINQVINWAKTKHTALCYANISIEDEDKIAMFESLDFKQTGPAEDFELDERMVKSVRMEKKI